MKFIRGRSCSSVVGKIRVAKNISRSGQAGLNNKCASSKPVQTGVNEKLTEETLADDVTGRYD